MVTPAAGLVALVPFPFSDLSQAKLRPAVILAGAGRDDWILCQVTSNPYSDPQAIVLTDAAFRSGSLRVTSYARPGKLFTANRSLMAAQAGYLKDETLQDIVDAVIGILRFTRSDLSLSSLCDAELESIANSAMDERQQARLQALAEAQKQRPLTLDEQSELSRLMDAAQRVMLRKAEAYRLLARRGYAVFSQGLG